MTTTETRPPLYLTKDQVANWFSLHSEDMGREIVVVESPVRGLSDEDKAAWQGLGNWQAGYLGGVWPERVLFPRAFLERPPRYVNHELLQRGLVTFFRHDRGAEWHVATYDLNKRAPQRVVDQIGTDAFVGIKVVPQ